MIPESILLNFFPQYILQTCELDFVSGPIQQTTHAYGAVIEMNTVNLPVCLLTLLYILQTCELEFVSGPIQQKTWLF